VVRQRFSIMVTYSLGSLVQKPRDRSLIPQYRFNKTKQHTTFHTSINILIKQHYPSSLNFRVLPKTEFMIKNNQPCRGQLHFIFPVVGVFWRLETPSKHPCVGGRTPVCFYFNIARDVFTVWLIFVDIYHFNHTYHTHI